MTAMEQRRPVERGPAPPVGPSWALAATLLLVALAVVPLVAAEPTLGAAAGAGLLVVALSALWPTHAVIAFVAVNPLIVGLERGAVVPALRLNEVLLGPVALGLLLAGLHRWDRAGWRRPGGIHRLDVVGLAVVVSGSVTPLLWMYARGREIAAEDIQYGLALWKLAALYVMVRVFVRGPGAVRALFLAIIASACVVAALGVLQAAGVGPVIDLLTRFASPDEDGFDAAGGRAMSTVGNPHAYGDVLVYAAVVAGALAVVRPRDRRVGAVLAVGLGAASLASGSFSTALALAVAGCAFAVVTRTSGWLVLGGALLAPLVYLGLQPVVQSRLRRLDPDTGLPASWTDRYGRLDNLETYFWPRIAEDFNWLLGVRPASRVPGEVREWVYIESGYTWALWNGGLPLLVAVLALMGVALDVGRRLRSATSPVALALGIVLSVVPWVLAFLMLLDPHLTIRGGAEFLFVLLALGATTDAARHRPASTAAPTAGQVRAP